MKINKSITVGKRSPRARHNTRGERYQIHQTSWSFDEFASSWADENKRETSALLKEVFSGAANLYAESALGMIEIRAKKNGTVGVFSVDILRTPYFFKDRDVSVTVGGRRKKVFHIVRPHSRLYASGRVSNVKMHFRGLREFQWNGYGIEISVPGKHHFSNTIFDVGAVFDDDDEFKSQQTLDMGQLGDFLEGHRRKGFLERRPS